MEVDYESTTVYCKRVLNYRRREPSSDIAADSAFLFRLRH